MAGARRQRLRVLLSLEKSRQAGKERRLPSVREYTRELRKIKAAFPTLREFSPWNEANRFQSANRTAGQPTRGQERRLAQFYMASRRVFGKRTTYVALDVLDEQNVNKTISFIRKFLRYARPRPTVLGFHNYSDTNRFSQTRTQRVLRAWGKTMWLTETGGIVKLGRAFPFSTQRAPPARWAACSTSRATTHGSSGSTSTSSTRRVATADFDAGLTDVTARAHRQAPRLHDGPAQARAQLRALSRAPDAYTGRPCRASADTAAWRPTARSARATRAPRRRRVPARRPPRPAAPATGAPRRAKRTSSDLKVRHVARAADDGYEHDLVPGLRATADAARLTAELAFAAARLEELAAEPPGLYAEVAGSARRATWRRPPGWPSRSPTCRRWRARIPFSSIAPCGRRGRRARPRRRRGLAGAAHRSRPARGSRTLDAYRAWAARAGSQAAALTADASWTPQRRFERAFERLSLPGFGRGGALRVPRPARPPRRVRR